MPSDIKINQQMDSMETELLKGFYRLEKTTEVRFAKLETKIDESVNGRFKENERRIENLESNQKWIVIIVLGAIVTAVMNMVLK